MKAVFAPLNFTCFDIYDGVNQCSESTLSHLGGRFYSVSAELTYILPNKEKQQLPGVERQLLETSSAESGRSKKDDERLQTALKH